MRERETKGGLRTEPRPLGSEGYWRVHFAKTATLFILMRYPHTEGSGFEHFAKMGAFLFLRSLTVAALKEHSR